MKSREARTTRSEHFDWVEAPAQIPMWSGMRNGLRIMEITYQPQRIMEDELPYVLQSHLVGHRSFTQGFASLEQAIDRADKRWAEWVHLMGLKADREWWKDEDSQA